MRGDRLARQWRILQLLSGHHEGLAVTDIADELGTNIRAIYRDLEVLQKAGFPLYTHREGRHSRWRLMDGCEVPQELPITRPELEAMVTARQVLRLLRMNRHKSSIESLLAKLEAIQPDTIRRELDRYRKRLSPSNLKHRMKEAVRPGSKRGDRDDV